MAENTTPKTPSGKTNAQVEEVADKEATVKATPAKVKNSVSQPAPAPAREKTFVVGNGDTDEVLASMIIVKNTRARKSLSVLHLQRALEEAGHDIASGDPGGFYGDHTIQAVRLWREAVGSDETGGLTHTELRAIFDGDPNVTLVLDTPEL